MDSRRTGFVGAGLPAANQDAAGIPDSEPVPEASPLFMGFEAGFRGNQATEDYVTLNSGPFAGGTTKVIANLRQRLDDWYGEQSYDQRVTELFSPGHTEEGLVEGVGANLGGDSGIDQFVDRIEADAEQYGRVGHAQKAARGNRDENGEVVKLMKPAIDAYMEAEVEPHVPDAWVDYGRTKVGYEIPFNRHFYVYKPPRELDEIEGEIKTLEGEIAKLLEGLVG